MKAPNTEVILCAAVGTVLLLVGEVLWANRVAVGLAVLGGGFLLAGLALGFAYWGRRASRATRVGAGLAGAGAAFTGAAMAYGAVVVGQGGAPPEELAFPAFLALALGIVIANVALARARRSPLSLAILVPVALVAWIPLEETAPAWGGVVGAAVFGGLVIAQLVAFRRGGEKTEGADAMTVA